MQAIVDRAHALAANKAGPSAQTATMEILERTLETRRDDIVDATGRVPTLQAAPETPANAGQTSADAPAEGSIEVVEDWPANEQDGGGEEIVLSAPEEEPSEDLQLREIYSRETHVNIAAVLRYVDGEKPRGAPHIVSEEAYRACHTLSGSSRMAEARHGIRLTAPLEHWVRKSFDSGVGLEAADLELLAECMNAMQSVASHLDESTGFFQSHTALLARIDQATEQLEQRIIDAARTAEATAAQPQVAAPQVSVAPAVAAPPASFPVAASPAPAPRSPRGRGRADGLRPGNRQHLY